MTHYIQGTIIKLTADFSFRNNGVNIFKMQNEIRKILKRNEVNQKFYIWQNYCSKIKVITKNLLEFINEIQYQHIKINCISIFLQRVIWK